MVPEWDMADRLRKALRHANLSVQDMASYLEVSRNTVSGWINGRHTAPKMSLRLWSIRCAVSYEWLLRGDGDGPNSPTGVSVTHGYLTKGAYQPSLSSLPLLCSNRRATPEWDIRRAA